MVEVAANLKSIYDKILHTATKRISVYIYIYIFYLIFTNN